MANKKTIRDLEAGLDRLHRRLNDTIRRINEHRDLIKKIKMGKVRQPPPAGIKVMLSKATPEMLADLDDPIPSFGDDPAIGG